MNGYTMVWVPIFALTGAGLGTFHFAALRWNVHLYLNGARWKAATLHLARASGSIGGFAFCAHFGGVALLTSLAAFQVVRLTALGRSSVLGRED